jgi:hypothetical protein
MPKWIDRLDDWITVQRVGLILLVLALVSGGIGYASQHPDGFDWHTFLGDFYANVSSEFASIAITVLIIDALNRRRDERSEIRREREQLIRRLGSTVNQVAKTASEDLRARGWLTDGTMQEADLRVANLEDARLWEADLQGADLQWANLKMANLNGAILVGANLRQAQMTAARLKGADLRDADLSEAKLYRVQFNGARLNNVDFSGAHLENARLNDADLRGAKLSEAFFDGDTVCPDGAGWTPDTDLTRFTDAQHPHFWQPDPANVGREGHRGE